jgi:hypothetical protein
MIRNPTSANSAIATSAATRPLRNVRGQFDRVGAGTESMFVLRPCDRGTIDAIVGQSRSRIKCVARCKPRAAPLVPWNNVPMDLDPVFLSRLQFAFVIAFHILLPAFTVGLASFIVLLEGLHVTKRDTLYLRLSIFWTRIFAVSFGMGVVSGIVMPFQFGTNWSRYSDATSNVLGPLFAYEGLVAFFLEAGFLGILLFGRKRVPPWAHFLAAVMVAVGTLFSAFWILAANSWMQTPGGHELVDGRFMPASWLDVIFNASFPYRLAHTVTGFLPDDGVRRAGRNGVAPEASAQRCRVAGGDGHDGDLHRDLRADPDHRGRSARAQHPASPAAESRRDGRAVGYAGPCTGRAVRDSGRKGRAQPRGNRHPRARQHLSCALA